MVLDMGRRGHMRGQVNDIGGASHFIERTVFHKLVGDRHDIDGVLLHVQFLDGLEDFLVTRLIEALRTKQLRYHREGILVDHQCTKHHLLNVDGLGLQMTIGRIDGRRSLATTA